MTNKELIKKAQEYLDRVNTKYLKESLEYLAFKEKGLVRDGTHKAMHLISYNLDFKSDFPIKHTLFIDAKTNDLMYIVTPHGYIEIEK